MAKLQIGDKAPSFTLKDQNDREVSLSGFEGQRLLLYFYPKAETPGCIKQAESIRDATPQRQKRFDEKHHLGFTLLSDRDHKVAEAYGVWGEKSRRGRTYEGIIRSSFLIDEHGNIAQANYDIRPEETVPRAQEAFA